MQRSKPGRHSLHGVPLASPSCRISGQCVGIIVAADINLLLLLSLFAGAALYSSVGHAGASAYIAAMALFGIAPEVMRPTALVLNVLVASFVSWRFLKAGYFEWRMIWPLLIGAAPMAFFGGSINLPGHIYRPIVGVILLIAAARLLLPGFMPSLREALRPMPPWIGIMTGAAIGLLAGLTGTGGGIFLSPLLIFGRWAEPRAVSSISITFILCNSLAGLLGNFAALRNLPAELPYFAAAVLAGAVIGSLFGVKRFATPMILKALGVVLAIAGLKMIGIA